MANSLLNFVVDLKAFERRLTEVISAIQPATGRWRSKNLYYYTWLIMITIYLLYEVVISRKKYFITNCLPIGSVLIN